MNWNKFIRIFVLLLSVQSCCYKELAVAPNPTLLLKNMHNQLGDSIAICPYSSTNFLPDSWLKIMPKYFVTFRQDTVIELRENAYCLKTNFSDTLFFLKLVKSREQHGCSAVSNQLEGYFINGKYYMSRGQIDLICK